MVMRRARHMIVAVVLGVVLALSGCRIEPPLNLAQKENVETRLGDVLVDLSVIWDIDADLKTDWWYGWDGEDVRLWGKIEYPMPSNYEVRLYYLGSDDPSAPHQDLQRFTIFDTSFRRNYQYGYHNVLAWSNIDSPDGTQSLIIDETDPVNIYATTTRSRFTHNMPEASAISNPEIFYSGYEPGFHVSEKIEDYDFYDPDLKVWVKQLTTYMYPLVYIYMVQVVIYNNHGRIEGITERAGISGLSNGVQIHTGITSSNEATVSYEMRLKKDLPARNGVHADILGGKLTTFGLCGMQSWGKSRAPLYAGTRADLRNRLQLGLQFSNSTDSIYYFDVTKQLQRQAHGGIVTVEIDADTITPPSRPGAAVSAGFDPTVAPADSITYNFTM